MRAKGHVGQHASHVVPGYGRKGVLAYGLAPVGLPWGVGFAPNQEEDPRGSRPPQPAVRAPLKNGGCGRGVGGLPNKSLVTHC